ncbi:MAG: alpha/beta hydrolase [Anaerolineae bacterium]|nr:alpha/beta hydrolase [Anaerolineae bacterium]
MTEQPERPRRRRRWVWPLIGLLALVMVGVPALCAATQKIGEVRDTGNHPPPGELIDVGGTRLHLHCEGEGSPTVVLEHGLGNTSLVWHRVRPALAGITRVCAFDRAGYGWSEPGPSPRIHAQAVYEIHTLLENAGVEKPFIYVGHAFGGLDAALYAGLYPEDVGGLVLLDPAAPDKTHFAAYRALEEAQIALFDLCATWLPWGITRLLEVLGSPDQLPEDMAELNAIYYRPGYCQTARAELADNIAPVTLLPLDTLPLTVLSRSIPLDLTALNEQYSAADSAAFEALWQATQADYAALSSRSAHHLAPESGHNIHLDRPDLVIDAVQAMIAAARGE